MPPAPLQAPPVQQEGETGPCKPLKHRNRPTRRKDIEKSIFFRFSTTFCATEATTGHQQPTTHPFQAQQCHLWVIWRRLPLGSTRIAPFFIEIQPFESYFIKGSTYSKRQHLPEHQPSTTEPTEAPFNPLSPSGSLNRPSQPLEAPRLDHHKRRYPSSHPNSKT